MVSDSSIPNDHNQAKLKKEIQFKTNIFKSDELYRVSEVQPRQGSDFWKRAGYLSVENQTSAGLLPLVTRLGNLFWKS